MSLKAVFVPFERNLLEEFSRELLKEMNGNDLSHTAVIFPGKRPYYYLLSILSEKCKRTIIPPLITSMDEFISKILSWSGFEFSLVSSIDSVYLLHKILKKGKIHFDLPDPYGESFKRFEDFLFWGFEILKILEEMDEELVDEKGIEMLRRFLLTGCGFSSLSPYEKIAYFLGDLLFRFHEEMEKSGTWTRGYMYRKASSLPISKILKERSIEKLFFVGFFLFTRSERDVIERAGDDLDANLFFHSSEKKEFEEVLKALRIENEVEIPPKENLSLKDKVSFHPASSLHFELFHLSHILKDEKEWDGVAMVLPRSESLIPLLSDLMSRFDAEYNVSMGYPLLRSPLFSLAESIMDLQEKKEGGLYYLNSYLSILKHPYVRNVQMENGELAGDMLRSIERKLLKLRLTFFSLDEIEKMEEGVKIIHEIFIKNFENAKTLKDLSIGFETLLDFLVSKSDFPSYPLSSELLEGFLNFLKEMKESLLKDEEFEIESLKRIFKGCAETHRIPLPGVPLRGCQIIGMLETRCLNFKKLIILDVNEGIIPGVRKHDPILSVNIRKTLGIPIYKENEKIYRYHFFRAVRSSERVFLFYIKNPEMPRSRFVEELIWEVEKETGKVIKEDEKRVSVHLHLPKNLNGIRKTPETMKLIEEMKFKPTGIDAYLACPLRFYYQEILKLSPRESIEEEVEPVDIGNVAHSALERLFYPFKDKILSQKEFSEMRESVEKNVNEAMKKVFPVITPERELLQKILTKAIEKYLDREEKGLKVLELEGSGRMLMKIDDKYVEISGRWDRVDKVGDKFRVVDYKTGGVDKYGFPSLKDEKSRLSRKEMKERKIRSLQLPCYVLLYKEKSGASNKVDAVVISLRDVFQDKWMVKLEDKFPEDFFRDLISGIIEEIMDPERPFYPDEENCSYCPYITPCLSMRTECSQ